MNVKKLGAYVRRHFAEKSLAAFRIGQLEFRFWPNHGASGSEPTARLETRARGKSVRAAAVASPGGQWILEDLEFVLSPDSASLLSHSLCLLPPAAGAPVTGRRQPHFRPLDSPSGTRHPPPAAGAGRPNNRWPFSGVPSLYVRRRNGVMGSPAAGGRRRGGQERRRWERSSVGGGPPGKSFVSFC